MAGNTRGKIKEHFEGIHRNLNWILYHCEKIQGLVADKHLGLKTAAVSLAEAINALDKVVKDVYSRI